MAEAFPCDGGPLRGRLVDYCGDRFDYVTPQGVPHRYVFIDAEAPSYRWDPWTQAEGAASGVSKATYEASCQPQPEG